MSFPAYLRTCLWEFLFCSLAAGLLAFCVADGFYLPAALANRPDLFVLPCLLVNGLAFAFSYVRRSAFCGLGVLALALLALLLWLYSGTAGEWGAFVSIVLLTALSAFFLSRIPLGAAIFGVAGVLIIVGSTLFEYGSRPVCLLLFLACSACLLLGRRYRAAMLQSSTFRPAVWRHTLSSVLVCAAAMALALGTFFTLIAPLNPPTYELELKTELKKLPLLEKLGVSSLIYIDDPDKLTQQTSGETVLSDQNREEMPDASLSEDAPAAPSPAQAFSPFDPTDTALAEAVNYVMRDYTLYYIAGGIVLLIAAVFAGRLLLRKLRLRRLFRLPPQRRIPAMYAYFLRAMEKCGLPPAAADTPLEYCARLGAKADRFFPGNGQFRALTEIFCRVYYGGALPTDGECTQFLRAYTALPARSRKSLGLPRYLPVFFQL